MTKLLGTRHHPMSAEGAVKATPSGRGCRRGLDRPCGHAMLAGHLSIRRPRCVPFS
jgi:hypothetical protein